jgi:hypothetical protein
MSLFQASCCILIPLLAYYGYKAGTKSTLVKQYKRQLTLAELDRDFYKIEHTQIQKKYAKLSVEILILRNFKFRFHEMVRLARSKKKQNEHS